MNISDYHRSGNVIKPSALSENQQLLCIHTGIWWDLWVHCQVTCLRLFTGRRFELLSVSWKWKEIAGRPYTPQSLIEFEARHLSEWWEDTIANLQEQSWDDCTSPRWPLMIVKQSPLPLLRGLGQKRKVSFNNMITENEKFTGLISLMHLAREMANSTHEIHDSRYFQCILMVYLLTGLCFHHHNTKYHLKTSAYEVKTQTSMISNSTL